MKSIAIMTETERNDEIAARIAAAIIREGKQKSTAMPRHMYGDPANFVKFANEPEAAELKTKEIEEILYHELDNWRRWCLKRDYMPTKGRDSLDRIPSPASGKEIDELQADRMERIVMGLPGRLKAVFIAHHLNKVVCGARVALAMNAERKYQLIGVNPRTYQRINADAHRAVLRSWQK